MTLEQEVNTLATSVENLTDTVKSKTGTLDAAVVDAQSATSQAQTAKTGALTARDEASAHKDAAYTAAQSAASAVAYQDLTALAESKAVNAVDVFIYDTSKDSDGGAWRHRCTGTSWYNEPLNTATRGSRREFPAVAVIVAEASKVTIYDGDDPALPMWIVFTQMGSSEASLNWWRVGRNATGIAALNGEIIWGQNSTSNGGMSGVNFLKDEIWGRKNNGGRLGSRTVVEASQGVNLVDQGGSSIISNVVNDVAMTVLPDAPIDPATGLEIPTIAIATDGGVSVIKEDGTVASYADGKGPKHVVFDLVTYNALYTQSVFNITTRAVLYPEYTNASYIMANNTDQPLKKIWVNAADGDCTLFDNTLVIGGPSNVGGTHTGLQRTLMSGTTPLAHAYTTSTYNTGWMPGDIKLAALSDTDDSDLVGKTVFEDDFSLYSNDTELNSAWSAINNAGVYLEEGTMKITSTGSYGAASDVALTVVGKKYVLSIDLNSNGSNCSLQVGGQQVLSPAVRNGVHKVNYTASSTSTQITVVANTSGSNSINVRSVSLDVADADRSVNNSGLIVNGTITREPVASGADLVAYSGFSADNYLEQPYNPDLDFGTGDFCVMGWVNKSVNGSVDTILSNTALSSAGGALLFGTSGSNLYFGRAATNSIATRISGGSALSTGIWYFAALVKRSDSLYLYLNGQSDATPVADTLSYTFTSPTLRVGLHDLANTFVMDGSLALLRISATAPTAEQIRKIYNDEKHLFQENAKCTLYGTSDAVTALAHDPDTDLLHVGTNQGRSVFKGLRRVDNTTTPVTTAIAANNGMVIEQ